jgi:hypothetical protein
MALAGLASCDVAPRGLLGFLLQLTQHLPWPVADLQMLRGDPGRVFELPPMSLMSDEHLKLVYEVSICLICSSSMEVTYDGRLREVAATCLAVARCYGVGANLSAHERIIGSGRSLDGRDVGGVRVPDEGAVFALLNLLDAHAIFDRADGWDGFGGGEGLDAGDAHGQYGGDLKVEQHVVGWEKVKG